MENNKVKLYTVKPNFDTNEVVYTLQAENIHVGGKPLEIGCNVELWLESVSKYPFSSVTAQLDGQLVLLNQTDAKENNFGIFGNTSKEYVELYNIKGQSIFL